VIGSSFYINTTFDTQPVNTTVFGLYPYDEKSLDPKTLWEIYLIDGILEVQIESIEWDSSYNDMIKNQKKQVSLLDTAIITNDSPATLNHEVSMEKKLSESFTTGFGTSTRFMESVGSADERSTEDTNSTTKSKSFSESVSDAVSSSITDSMSHSSSHSKTHTDTTSKTDSSGFSLGGLLSFGSSETHETSDSETNEDSNSNSHEDSKTNSHSEDNSKSTGDENSNSKTDTKTHSDQLNKEKENSNNANKENTITKEHTYTISKTVEVPPYSAVKISSYANWVENMKMNFKINLKFTAKSYRRKMDKRGTNSWRSVDADGIEYMLKLRNFPGRIIRKHTDVVIGQIDGKFTGSFGLESVFSSKEVDTEDNNN
jgi:hypothetical protein